MTDALKVLYVDGGMYLGGASVCLAELLPHMTHVQPVVQHSLPEANAQIFARWETVHEAPWNAHVHAGQSDANGTSSFPFHGILVGLNDVRRYLLPAVKRAGATLRTYDIDLVHCNNNVATNLPAMIAARRLDIPCIVHERIFEPRSRIIRLLGRGATTYVCMSEAIAEQLIGWGIPREKTRVIYDGIDLATLEPPREQTVNVTIGTVSRFVGWKGLDVFVDAALRVAPQCPNARFLFVGGPAPEEPDLFEQLKRRCAESPHADRFTFTGECPNGWERMREMDVFVHTAREPEPFGRVLIEAMAAGCAVVSTDHGGPREICADGAGLLLPPGDGGALADTLERLIHDPQERAALAARGQARVRTQFDLADTARHFEALYAECLTGTPAAHAPTGTSSWRR